MKYQKVKIERLFHGYGSVRDYIVAKAKRLNYGLKLEWNGKTMTLEPKDLDKGYKNNDIFWSKHQEGLKYSLIDYDFKEDKLPIQENLFREWSLR